MVVEVDRVSISSHSRTRSNLSAALTGNRQDRPRVTSTLHHRPTSEPSLMPFSGHSSSLSCPFPVWPVLSLRVRSITCSIIGGGRGGHFSHLPRLSAPDKTTHQSNNQSIRFFQKSISKSQLGIHSPCRDADQGNMVLSCQPDCQTARLATTAAGDRKHSQHPPLHRQIRPFCLAYPST